MLSSVQRLLFVRKVPIFKELRDDFLIRLAWVMKEVSFGINQAIFTQGDDGRSLYIVISGRVRIHIGENELAQVGQGGFFGEMSLFDSEPRSASITTLAPCTCLVLTQQQLYEAIEETPGIAVNIIAQLSYRIRDLNNKLSEAEQVAHAAGQTSPNRLSSPPAPTIANGSKSPVSAVQLPQFPPIPDAVLANYYDSRTPNPPPSERH